MDPVLSGADPTTPLEAFNNKTDPAGGDSQIYDLNVFYQVRTLQLRKLDFRVANTCSRQSGDIAWMITATALVLLMIPGVG
jgi:Amt family ammonium transporter